jgi:hypothetical protein
MTPPDGAHKRLLLRERAPWNLTKRAQAMVRPQFTTACGPIQLRTEVRGGLGARSSSMAYHG